MPPNEQKLAKFQLSFQKHINLPPMQKTRKKRIFKVNLKKRPFFKHNHPLINEFEIPSGITETMYILEGCNQKLARKVVTSKRNR